jgi:5'-phosphate synthase pdxT subunit
MDDLKIGILALQGDIEENIDATSKALTYLSCKGKAVEVRYPDEIETIDGIILPGGESTVIGNILSRNADLWRSVRRKLSNGMPALGTCAGMIIMATKAYNISGEEMSQQLLGVFDIEVERNSFGRQIESFETDLQINFLGEDKFRGVFIRAPSVKRVGPNVKILGRLDHKIVAVQQGNMIGTSFHPELSGDNRFHTRLVQLITDHRIN